jgi:hypothetical protein
LLAAADQEPVEAVAADGAGPAFGECVRLRGAKRGADDLDALAAEDLVECATELAVAAVNQEPGPNRRRLRYLQRQQPRLPGAHERRPHLPAEIHPGEAAADPDGALALIAVDRLAGLLVEEVEEARVDRELDAAVRGSKTLFRARGSIPICR